VSQAAAGVEGESPIEREAEMFHIVVRAVSLAFNCILSGYVLFRRRREGVVRALAAGTGVFTAAWYLDNIFTWIMAGAAGGSQGLMQESWILISKGILTAVLLTGGGEPQIFRDREWRYMDGLTAAVNLFFLTLAAGISRGMKSTWSRAVDGSRSALTEGGQEMLSAAWGLTFLLAVLLGYHFSLYYFEKRQQGRMRQYEAEARKHEADLYLEHVEENYQRTRELWHDLKNHITLLHLLLQEGKYEQMEEYLRVFGEDVDSLALPMKSGNLVVDAVLSDKLARARKEKIAVTLSLCDLSGLLLKPDEICGLLGNLLDNALEACRQVEEGRFLAVDCQERADCYYIWVQNACGGAGEKADVPNQVAIGKTSDAASFQTSSKSDRRNRVGHGLGLRSVERIVHGCGGEAAVDRTGNRFTVSVRIPKNMGQT